MTKNSVESPSVDLDDVDISQLIVTRRDATMGDVHYSWVGQRFCVTVPANPSPAQQKKLGAINDRIAKLREEVFK